MAIGLIGGLIACTAAHPPSDPIASRIAPSSAPATKSAIAAYLPLGDAAPASSTLALAVPALLPPGEYSGSSTPPQTGRTGSRRHRQTAWRSHRYRELDEEQIRAQWINPPLGAGE
jgi:hypothetical protein